MRTRKVPSFHNLPNRGTDYIHFGSREPISSSKVARGACRAYIIPGMRESIVYSVEPARLCSSTAVGTWERDKRKNFFGGKVTSVGAGVRFPKEYCPTTGCPRVLTVPAFSFFTLVGGHIYPPVCSAVTTFLSRAVALTAFISQPERPSAVAQEFFRCSRKLLFAAVTNPVPGKFSDSSRSSHTDMVSYVPTTSQYGTH